MTCAFGALLKMISEYSEKQITWVLTIIPEAYEDQKGMLRPNLIHNLANEPLARCTQRHCRLCRIAPRGR
jgi:hypothetical protein